MKKMEIKVDTDDSTKVSLPKSKSDHKGVFELIENGEEFKLKNKSFLGIELKHGYNIWNLLAIPFCIVCTTVAGTFTNTSVIFLLRDPDYFNIPNERIGRVSNDVIFYSIPIAMVSTIFVGYIFDIFGRRLTLFFSAMLMAFFMILVPFTSPHVYPWLIFVRMALAAAY
jgi:MFS family permease